MADFELQVALDTSPVLRQILDIGRRLDETFSRVKPLGITADTTQAETKLAALAKTVIRPRVDPDLGTFSSRFDKQIIDAEKKVIALQSELAGAIIEGASAQEIEKIRQALGAAEGEAKKFRAALNSAQGIGGAGGATEAPATTASPIAVPKNAAFQFNQITQSVTTLSNAVSGLSAPFIELDTATQSLKTLGAEAAAMAPNLREAAIAMSSELPFAAAEIQQTMFDALASGVKGGEEGLKGFADTAAKLAVGGGAQIAESTNLLAGQLNAYGKSAEEAGKFSDIFFNTVNYGVTSIPALANSLSNVIPTAAAAGVELENVGAALAVMTSKGVPTAQSTTKLNQLLLEIQKPGAALAGVLKKAGVSMESLKQDDLPVTLEKINSALKATGKTATTAFSSSEASAAFNVLAGDLEGFKQTFLDVRDTTGSTQFAYEQMADGIASRTKQMQVIVEGFAIKGFDLLGNGFVTLTQSATQLAPTVATLAGLKGILPEGMGARAVELGRSLLSTVVPSLFATEGAAATTGFSFSGMWAAATGPVGLVIAGIVAIVAIIAVLYNKFEAVRNVLDAVFEGFLDIAQKWGAAAAEFGGLLFDVLVAPFELLWAFVSPLVGAIGDLFSSIFSGAGNAGGAVSGIAAVFEFLGNVLDTVKATFAGFRAGLAEFIAVIGEIVDRVKNLDFSGAADVALKAGGRIAGAMKGGFTDSFNDSQFNDAVEKAAKTAGDAAKIQAKVELVEDVGKSQEQLTKIQAKLPNLETKVRIGSATAEEKAEFDTLTKKAEELSKKIAEAAPAAAQSAHTIRDSQGQLHTIYDISKEKVADYIKEQSKENSDALLAKQKKYTAALNETINIYDYQKKQLEELRIKRDAALAKGDNKGAEKIKEDYDKLSQKVTENATKIREEFGRGDMIIASEVKLPEGSGADFVGELQRVTDEAAAKLQTDKVKEAVQKGFDIQPKIDTQEGLLKLAETYKKAQTEIKPLELKVQSGKATADEKKRFEELKASIQETAAAIKKDMPEAVSATNKVVDANGNLTTSYEINTDVVKQNAEENKKRLGGDAKKAAEGFIANIGKEGAGYRDNIAKLKEITLKIDEKKSKGQAASVAEQRQLNDLKGATVGAASTVAALANEWEKNAVRTGAAKDKTEAHKQAVGQVATALGVTNYEAEAFLKTQQQNTEEAEKTAFNVNTIGDAFNSAKSAAKGLIDQSIANASGAATDLQKLRATSNKNLEEELKSLGTKYQQEFEDRASAEAFLTKTKKEERKKQAEADREALQLEATERSNSIAAGRKETELSINNALAAKKTTLKEELIAEENKARTKAKLEKQSEEELQVALLKIQQDNQDKALAAEIKAKEDILAKKVGLSAEERNQEQIAINSMASDRTIKFNEANAKIAEAEGKARSAKLERERKALDDVTKLSIDSAQRRIDALQTVEAQTVTNAEKLANERVNLAKIKGAEEVRAFIEGTKEFKDAELVIQADVKANNISPQEAIKLLEQLRKDIADGLITGADPLSAAYNALTRKQAADEAKLRIDNASAIEKARLNTIENAEIRQRELAIAEAKKQYAEELRLAGDNENLQYLAFKKFKAAQVAAETAYLEKTRTLYETSAIGLLNKLSAAIQKAFNPDPQAAEEAKKGLDELAKKEKELYKARAANSISFEDFQKQLADLSKQEAELKDKLGGIGFNVGQAFVTAFGEALGGLSEVMREQTTKSVSDYSAMGNSIKRTDSDIAELREESKTADVTRQAEITSEITKLEKERGKAAREASDIATNAYTSMGIAVGATLVQMALSGKANIGQMVIAALDGLQALVPVISAQIFGLYSASPTPINVLGLGIPGAVAAAATTLAFTGLVELAKAAVRSGYKTGGYTGDAPADEVTGVVHGQEIVFEAPIVRGQKKDVLELRRIMQSGVSAADILNAYKRPPVLSDWSVGAAGVLTMPQPPGVEYRRAQTVVEFTAALARVESRVRDISVNMPVIYKQDNGELLKELRAIRAELAEVKAAQYETAKEYRAHTSVEMHVTSDTEVIGAKLKRSALKNILRG